MERHNIITYIFVIILLAHGLIHLMGFVSPFFSTSIEKQVLGISKPIGSIWLIVSILFIVSAPQFLANKKWFYIAWVAVIVSQILIVMAWKEAKFGTIVNVIILLVSFCAFGTYRFEKMVDKEFKDIVEVNSGFDRRIITRKNVQHLPEIIQKWLHHSGVVGSNSVRSVKLKQKGEIRIKPNSKWMPFEAAQYFNTNDPSFVWSTNVEAMPIISMLGRDKLVNGEGEMLIKLAGLIPVVNASKNKKINSGTMIRYLSELCWFPQAAINDYIHWEAINSTSVKATFTYKDKSVSGIFSFTEEGDLNSFEAERYYGGTEDSKLENWRVETISFKSCHGIKIPNKSKVIWKLEEGDFHWLTVEIIDIDYNVIFAY